MNKQTRIILLKTAIRFALLVIFAFFFIKFMVKDIIIDSKPADTDSVYLNLIAKIDSLKSQVYDRDSLLSLSSDTVIYRSNKTREIIKEYYTVHDTIEKLRYCDSLAEECNELAIECLENDSLHKRQEKDLKSIISRQDTLIFLKDKDLATMKKRRDLWRMSSAGLGSALLVALVKKSPR